MTSPASEFVWPAITTAPPAFETACECGRHTVTDFEPQICPRCGSLRITVSRLAQLHRPAEGDL
jgi:Zn finger protein HypA/HybF involved in hydrogenase expression